MDPPERSSGRACKRGDPNPFVAFRRFADEQMSSLMNSVAGFSSTLGFPTESSRSFLKDYESWLKDMREQGQRLDDEEQEARGIVDLYRKARSEGDESEPNDERPLKCPYLSEEPTDSQDGIASTTRKGLLWPRPRDEESDTDQTTCPSPIAVPVAYMLSSPFSPFHLEAVMPEEIPFWEEGAEWRHAFEDLLAVQSGNDMPEERYRFFSDEEEGSPGDHAWIRSLIQKGYLAGWDGKKSRQPDSTDAEESLANIKMALKEKLRGHPGDNEECGYDAIRSTSKTHKKTRTNDDAYDAPAQQPPLTRPKPDILSTLTSTECVRSVDGTVHTRVVLKKRFADGREESTETEHTSHPGDPAREPQQQQQQSQPRSSPASQVISSSKASHKSIADQAKAKADDGQKKGWFWS